MTRGVSANKEATAGWEAEQCNGTQYTNINMTNLTTNVLRPSLTHKSDLPN